MSTPVTAAAVTAATEALNALEDITKRCTTPDVIVRLVLEAAAPHLAYASGDVDGSSRRIGRSWSRLDPGVQGRLVAFGGTDDDAYAWIDVRAEPRMDAGRVQQLQLLAQEMLASYTRTSDGWRGRVGQVTIARWRQRLDSPQ